MGVCEYRTCHSTRLTKHLPWDKLTDAIGPVAQLGERYNRTVEAKGSNPFRSTQPKPGNYGIEPYNNRSNGYDQE
jgi:hypothetical protein